MSSMRLRVFESILPKVANIKDHISLNPNSSEFRPELAMARNKMSGQLSASSIKLFSPPQLIKKSRQSKVIRMKASAVMTNNSSSSLKFPKINMLNTKSITNVSDS